MSKLAFKVNITPAEALGKVKDHHLSEGNELIHEELYDLGEGKAIGTLVFQKYYFRAGTRAALVVIADNLKVITRLGQSQRVAPRGSFSILTGVPPMTTRPAPRRH